MRHMRRQLYIGHCSHIYLPFIILNNFNIISLHALHLSLYIYNPFITYYIHMITYTCKIHIMTHLIIISPHAIGLSYFTLSSFNTSHIMLYTLYTTIITLQNAFYSIYNDNIIKTPTLTYHLTKLHAILYSRRKCLLLFKTTFKTIKMLALLHNIQVIK